MWFCVVLISHLSPQSVSYRFLLISTQLQLQLQHYGERSTHEPRRPDRDQPHGTHRVIVPYRADQGGPDRTGQEMALGTNGGSLSAAV